MTPELQSLVSAGKKMKMRTPSDPELSLDVPADPFAFELAHELEKALKFKDWVHSWLDAQGVPADPDPEGNKQHGCRISGRMRFLLARAKTAEGENTVLRGMVARLMPCHYCGVDEIAKCPKGFPGCSLADDLIMAEEEIYRTTTEERN